MSLSPWDLSGNISFDFSLYRPRRPSYVFATQVARRRNESYRHATKTDAAGTSGEQGGIEDDFIEGIVKKKRKDSYRQATEDDEINIELGPVLRDGGGAMASGGMGPDSNHIGPIPEVPNEDACSTVSYHVPVHDRPPISEKKQRKKRVRDAAGSPTRHRHRRLSGSASDNEIYATPGSVGSHRGVLLKHSKWRYRKNLIVLSVSFILIFTAFRSIQNLQSSLNTEGRLGVIAMACVHGTMFLTCLFAPVLINKLTSKWTIVLGLLFYLFWIVANFYPHFYTLIPTSIGVGFGQSLAWGAQITYIQKLAIDYAHLSRELTHQELSKFNGIFLACFQTTHIWGNVISSVMLSPPSSSPQTPPQPNSHDDGFDEVPDFDPDKNMPFGGGGDYNDTGYGMMNPAGGGNMAYPSNYPSNYHGGGHVAEGVPPGEGPRAGVPEFNSLKQDNGPVPSYPQGPEYAGTDGVPLRCGIYDPCQDQVPRKDGISNTGNHSRVLGLLNGNCSIRTIKELISANQKRIRRSLRMHMFKLRRKWQNMQLCSPTMHGSGRDDTQFVFRRKEQTGWVGVHSSQLAQCSRGVTTQLLPHDMLAAPNKQTAHQKNQALNQYIPQNSSKLPWCTCSCGAVGTPSMHTAPTQYKASRVFTAPSQLKSECHGTQLLPHDMLPDGTKLPGRKRLSRCCVCSSQGAHDSQAAQSSQGAYSFPRKAFLAILGAVS